MAAFGLQSILERVSSHDKDFRYMAGNDLKALLKRPDFRPDQDTQRKLVAMVHKQLDDADGDIALMAAENGGLLVGSLDEVQLRSLLQQLCERCTRAGKKVERRDIATIALKTVLEQISADAQVSILVDVVAPSMVKGIGAKDAFEVVNESLDIAVTLLERFGSSVSAKGYNQQLLPLLLPLLSDHRMALRKRTIACLAALAVFLDSKDLETTAQQVLQQLDARSCKPEISRTYMQTVAALSRAVGHRFGPYLPTAVPLAISYCNDATDDDVELQEYCLQALESFVQRSPHDMRASLEAVADAALQYLSHDPNYDDADDMDAQSAGGDEDDDDADEELSEQEEYSDDDDGSWKVRRAAARILAAIIATFPDLLPSIYPKVFPALLARFREREETVKGDVFATFITLLEQVGRVAKYSGGRKLGPLTLLGNDAPAVIKAAAQQLGDRSVKTRTGALQVLQELVAILPDSMQAHIAAVLPPLVAILNDKSSTASTMKIQALVLLRVILAASFAQTLEPHIRTLSKPLLDVLQERYYKVVAEALRVAEELIRTMRPSAEQNLPACMQEVVEPLHAAVGARLAASDQDLEVKDAAISCTAASLALLGDVLGSQVPSTQQVLLERTRNEITRVAAVRAWAVVAASPLSGDLGAVLAPLTQELTSYMRKANRVLRTGSVTTLEVLVATRGAAMDAGLLEAAVAEAAALVSDTDLTVTALSLQLAAAVLQHQPKAGPSVAVKVLPAGMALVASPLLQAAALRALQGFFVALIDCKPAKVTYKQLLTFLLEAGRDPSTGKAAQLSVAQCIAALCVAAGDKQVTSTVTTLLKTLGDASDEAAQRLALLTLGEIGRSTDLSSYSNLQSIILSTLQEDGKSEELKGAASVALGGLTTSALPQYLSPLLQAASQQARQPKVQFLLLAALNEALTSLAAPGADPTTLSAAQRDEVLAVLVSSVEGEDDVRGVVAECLGHCALIAPEPVVKLLLSRLSDPSPAMRAAVAAAVRCMVVEQEHSIDALLKPSMPQLLGGLADSDRHVRRAAVQSLSAVAHHKPALLEGALQPLLPLLYKQTVLDESLIRVVDLGPFKHKIDDGLELRKAAFEAMDVLLDAAAHQLDLPRFIDHLIGGLQDIYDVKLPCHLLLVKATTAARPYVVTALDRLVGPLTATLNEKLKSDAVKQEVDRNEDMVRSCLRAVDAISCIPETANVAEWKRFMAATVGAGPLKPKFEAVVRERAELPSATGASSGAATAMDLS